MKITMQNVEGSSNIDEVGYDPDTKTLAVKFFSGQLYHYKEVPKEKYQGLINAKSVGGYFYANIKDLYTCERQ